MTRCTHPECRDEIYKKIEDEAKELKKCINAKADKLPLVAKIGVISLVVTVLIFIGGGPLMYSISAAKEKQQQISNNEKKIERYSVKQDVIILNQQEFKHALEKINDKRETDQKELNKKLERIMKALDQKK